MDNDRIQNLIERPSESLSIELKGWFDPDTPEGISKIVRGALAMRNHGGGYILIGFHNDNGLPDIINAPPDVRSLFHIDKIQCLLGKYSSEPFEVIIHFPVHDGQEFPVLEIPSGIKTPVAAKSNLLKGGNKPLIKANQIYIRTLLSNNTPSTSEATWKDYGRIVEVCFDNREADIGRFLRRHLGVISPKLIQDIAFSMTQSFKPDETIEDKLSKFLQESEQRFVNELDKRELPTLPEHGTWEVGLMIIGDIPPYEPNINFLNLLESSNPNYTGWPVWLDSRGFSDADARPYVFDGAWEALIIILNAGWNEIDFMRLHPKGKFYLRRALEDDISINPLRPKPMTCLDFGLPITRTAEAILVGLGFAKSMGCELEKTQLAFAFKWSKLRGRILSSWAWPGRYISPNHIAYQDAVFAMSYVPLETPESAITPFVYDVIKQLFIIFNGFDPGSTLVEDFVKRLIERRHF